MLQLLRGDREGRPLPVLLFLDAVDNSAAGTKQSGRGLTGEEPDSRRISDTGGATACCMWYSYSEATTNLASDDGSGGELPRAMIPSMLLRLSRLRPTEPFLLMGIGCSAWTATCSCPPGRPGLVSTVRKPQLTMCQRRGRQGQTAEAVEYKGSTQEQGPEKLPVAMVIARVLDRDQHAVYSAAAKWQPVRSREGEESR